MIRNRLILQGKAETERILRELLADDDEVFIKKFEYGNSKITIFISENFYFRINSDLTLTVIAEETCDKTTVEVISGGGKEGLLGLSYGAERSAAQRVVKVLKDAGFAEQ